VLLRTERPLFGFVTICFAPWGAASAWGIPRRAESWRGGEAWSGQMPGSGARARQEAAGGSERGVAGARFEEL
jgi:hypothetical protein